jgi:DNA-directed RNA polymerase specialized sigma24 family protein
MSLFAVQKMELKKNWTLSPSAFNKFLAWLDAGEDSAGQKYVEMQHRLVAYFDRKNCLNPDELADETINRVARRLEEEGAIKSETPAKYCYITAKFVFLEYLRSAEKASLPLDEGLAKSQVNAPGISADRDEKEIKEKRLNCLEHCTGKLDDENRRLIFRYYYGKERIKIENRRALAGEFGITVNALSIRACRIRDKLESCVGKCVEGELGGK